MSRVLYASVTGSLMYAIICTRPNLTYAVSTLSQFMSNPDYAKNLDQRRSTIGYVFIVTECVIS